MFKKFFLLLLSFFFISLVFVSFVFGVSDNSSFNVSSLDKIRAYNESLANDFLLKISLFVAFLAGVLTILSPCVLPLFPAYFAVTFKERKNITVKTFLFFLGFSLIFVLFGVLAGFVGERSLSAFQNRWVVFVAGLLLLFFGFLILLGKDFSSFLFSLASRSRISSTSFGVFSQGLLFALGWSACVGPVLSGILTIAVFSGKIFYSGFLLFFYSLGIFVPLLLFSLFYDSLGLANKPFFKGRVFSFSLFGHSLSIHSSNLFAGLLLLLLGFAFIFFGGTSVFNRFYPLWLNSYFYSFQRWLINWPYSSLVGFVVLLFLFSLFFFLFFRKNFNFFNGGDK